MCFDLHTSPVHTFFSHFSRVGMFCNEYYSKLVPESTYSGVFWVVKCWQPNEITKSEHLILKRKVVNLIFWLKV